LNRKIGHIFFFLQINLFCIAQDDNPVIERKLKLSPLSIRADFSVPNPTNKAWKKCMVGVFEGNVSLNYKIPKSQFFLGVGYKGNLFYTPPKFFIFDLKTKMQMHAAYLKLGYDINKDNGFFITPSLNTGWSYTSYTGVICETKKLDYTPAYDAWFIEPGIHLNFLPESNFGISCSFTYVLVDQIWNPDYICMNDHINLGDTKKNALTGYYNLGLGIYWGIGKR
jgi:hypothetical protein